MKVAAFQAPLGLTASAAIAAIRQQVTICETAGAMILCCPEAILGGLADYADDPVSIAINVSAGELEPVLSALGSATVTTVVGFTEVDNCGRLFSSAAVFHGGAVVGLYRKLRPAINTSVYTPGHELRTFTVGALCFGILICRDSIYPEHARELAARGAAAIFVPTNNGMPPRRGGPELVLAAREMDTLRASELGIAVIRADVAGHAGSLVSFGATGIVDETGAILATSRPAQPDLIFADIRIPLALRGL